MLVVLGEDSGGLESVKEEKWGPAVYRLLSRFGVPCLDVTAGPGFWKINKDEFICS